MTVVVHAVAVAILAAISLATGADAVLLSLIVLGAPWGLAVCMLLWTLPWTVLTWLMPLGASYHGVDLMLIAAAVLNVGLHALAAERGHVVLSQIVRRPPLLVAAVTVVACAVAVPLAAYASDIGGGPTTTLLILVGGVVVPVGVAVVGGVGRREAA
jgi:hypothetical protein